MNTLLHEVQNEDNANWYYKDKLLIFSHV